MNNEKIIKNASEIGMMAGKLTLNNQLYVLNTINALLYSQKINNTKQTKKQEESENYGKTANF